MSWFHNADLDVYKEFPVSAQPMIAQSGWFPSDPPPEPEPPVEDTPAPEVAAPVADEAPVAVKQSLKPRPAKES